jgi:hypothetical protein
MPVNPMYANIYLAQVDEETVEPGAKIAGFHTLFYDSVMSSLILMFAILVSVFFVYKMPIVTLWSFCHC